LETSGDQSVDVFSNRHKDFPSQMTALLAAMQLIFEMNSRSTVLREKLGQFEDRGKTAMSV
jgi:hypothetical protein